MKRIAVCLVAMALLASAAHSQIGTLDKRVVNIQSAPLRVTNIEAGPQTPTWVGQTTWPVAPGPNLPLYLQVQNVSQQTIYGYRLMVTAYDAFGDYVDTIRACAVTSLSTQSTDLGRWSLPIRNPDSAWTVVCYVDAVRFQDGTVWRIDPVTVAALVPSTAPVRFHAWHIIPDPREILPVKMKDIPAQPE